MGKLVIIDGPEKAGKTTAIRDAKEELETIGWMVKVRKLLGRAIPDDSIYESPLIEDMAWMQSAPKRIVFWDRSWVSEFVYGRLLGDGRRLASSPWLGEWLYSRALYNSGKRYIFKGPVPEKLAQLRDGSDLDVDPEEEQALFLYYASRFKWTVVPSVLELSLENPRDYTKALVQDILRDTNPVPEIINPEKFAGRIDSPVLFVTDLQLRSVNKSLPFTSNAGTDFAMMLGDHAFQCGWTYTRTISPHLLRRAKLIISFGALAGKWTKYYVGGTMPLINTYALSYLLQHKNRRLLENILQNVFAVLEAEPVIA